METRLGVGSWLFVQNPGFLCKQDFLCKAGIIPRFSSAWKELYRKRNSIERYFSSAKQSRLLNQHECLGQAKVRNPTVQPAITSTIRI